MNDEPETRTADTQQQPQQPPGAPAPAQVMVPSPPAAQLDPARVRVTLEALAMFPDSEARTQWINGLVEADLARQYYSYDLEFARRAAESGQFDDLKKLRPEQAIATALIKIQLGRSYKFTPADSMRSVYFTNGKPGIENDIVASRLQEAGYSWDIVWAERTEKTPGGGDWQRCVGCTLYLKKMNPVTKRYEPMNDLTGKQIGVAFLEGDAKNAMMYDRGGDGGKKALADRDVWRSFPRDMYFHKCVARVKKYYAPNVLRGAMSRTEADEFIPDAPEVMPTRVEIGGMTEQPAQVEPPPRSSLREKVLQQGSFAEKAEAEKP